jgi:AraC family transcriptional regulator, regulatory protein of adaptative response / DNA-3-methyladenine glycosylase II
MTLTIFTRGTIFLNTMHLPTAQPFDGAAVLDFLAARAITGVEEVRDGTYRRTLALPHGTAILALTPVGDGVTAEFTLDDERDKPEAIRRARALFGLDADPRAVAAHFDGDPHLGPLVRARPGLRVPGVVDGWEIAARAVLGQQITVAAARTLASRITAAVATPLPTADGALTHLFPTPAQVAAAPDEVFTMPRSRARTLRELATADPQLAASQDAAALQELWGIGPWTAGYVALRLGDPDVFLDGDVAVQRALRDLGADPAAAPPSWSPWRSYAVLHLWAGLAGTPA